jgi:hypothetical protein
MLPRLLSPLTRQVVIAGRQFILREMTASQVERYLDELSCLSAEDLPAFGASPRASRMSAFLSWLLGGAGEEFIRENVTPSIVRNVIEIQNELNGLDRLLKKTETSPQQPR